jgi:hypothetical protein
MDLLRWMGRVFARFVAVSVTLIGAWTFVVNIGQPTAWEPWVYAWIIASGIIGTVGGVAYLLSLDGPTRFQRRLFRLGGWLLMLLAVVLPTNLTFMLVPLVLVLIPTLFTLDGDDRAQEEPVTSA